MPWTAKFGLSQYDRLRSSSENVYRIALERMFRSRLIYRMEEVLDANRTSPGFLYEALKVYLMLGSQQPADRELIVSWMRRDWADNLYPGAGNASGRKALEEHLTAMLDLETDQEPLITLHGPLIEETQKTLARLSVSQRAYELLKSQSRSAQLADWVPAQRGGPDFALVFAAAGGQDVNAVSVPGSEPSAPSGECLGPAEPRSPATASASRSWGRPAASALAAPCSSSTPASVSSCRRGRRGSSDRRRHGRPGR